MKKHEIGSAFLILILLVFGVYMINEENKNQTPNETVIVNEETPKASKISEPEPVADNQEETVKEDKLFPLEGEGQEELRELFKDSSEQDKRLAELGYYKAAEYVMDGVEGYAFLMPGKHMEKCFENPYDRHREAFMRSGFDVGECPPTSAFSLPSFHDVYICFTPKPKK